MLSARLGRESEIKPGRAQRRLHPLQLLLLGGTAFCAMSVGAAAQDKNEPVTAAAEETKQPINTDVLLLERISIVSRTGESPIEAAASMSQIEGEALTRRMASNSSELFFGIPGVAIQTDARRAGSAANIRGLQDFGRVQVIVDGARQNFQRSGHGTSSMYFVDPELLSQVDVVRGPVSNTYGSGAIGGVIFMTTKDASEFLRPDQKMGGSVSTQYDSSAKGITTSVTGAARSSETFDVLGNVVYRDFDRYRDGNGNRVDGTQFDVLSGLFKATIRPTDDSSLKLGWNGTNDEWHESADTKKVTMRQNTLSAQYHLTDPDLDWLDLHLNGAINNVDLNNRFLTPSRQFNSQTGMPITIPAGAQTKYDLSTYSLDLWNTSRFDTGSLSHELTYGGDWVRDRMDTLGPDGLSDTYTPSGSRAVWGAYVQDKIAVTDWLELIGSIRYDGYELKSKNNESSGERFSPRLTAAVSPFTEGMLSGLKVYGTYAEGYRSPSITETLMNGLHPNGVVFPFLPNTDLRPETAKTWEIGVNYQANGILDDGDNLKLKAAYFDNRVSDYIGLQQLSGFPINPTCPVNFGLLGMGNYAPICYQYQNFASARINGFELEALYDQGDYFGGLSANLNNGRQESYAGVRSDILTLPAAQVTGSLGMRFFEGALTVGGEVQHNVVQKAAIYAKDYTLVNLYASYQATDDLRFDARLDNLLDVQYANPLNASTTDVVYEPGLNLKLGATLRF